MGARSRNRSRTCRQVRRRAFDEIERCAHSLLGKMSVEPGRGLFPLTIETAEPFARFRIALVGEAAHVVPPIGAQGLNLGLRDVATIAELVADARRQSLDVGAPSVLARYDAQRHSDVISRSFAVDALNQSLLTDFILPRAPRPVALSRRPHRPAAPRADARRRRARRLAAAPDARRDGVSNSRQLPQRRHRAPPTMVAAGLWPGFALP